MRTWRELEIAFRALAPKLDGGRLDLQWGAAGEYWRIAAIIGPAVAEFAGLARIAGAKLAEIEQVDPRPELSGARDDTERWILALRHLSGAMELRSPAQQLHDDGTSAGWLYSGTIIRVAEVSANLCLHIEGIAQSRISAPIQHLAALGLAGAKRHLEKAHDFRSQDHPDLANACKEAVSCLEAVAQTVTSLPKATLGDCLKEMRRTGRLNTTLIKSLEGIWAFSNQSPGVRHGSSEHSTPRLNETDYVITVCEAAIALLLQPAGST